MKYLYGLCALVLLAAGLIWIGHHRGYADGVAAAEQAAQQQINKATGARNQAVAERVAATQTLTNVQRALDAQKRELQVASYIADAAMEERAGLQRALAAATAQRDTALRKAAHEHPDCAGLVHLPVCPAVAERLWGKQADGPTDTRH